jgi:glycopeptide antibiotics resistance protein
VSLNDIVVETIGAVAGTVVWLIGGQRITQWVRRLTAPTDLWRLAARLLPGYMVLLLVIALMPFDFAISRSELAVKLEENKIWLVPFSHYGIEPLLPTLAKLILNMACYFPLGFLLAMADQAQGVRRKRWPYVLVIGLGVTTLVECLQLLVYSRTCDTTDVITGTLAVMLGWQTGWVCFNAWRVALARSSENFFAVEPAPKSRGFLLAALFLAWFGGALYLNWTPFNFTADPAKFTDGPEELPIHGLRRMSFLPIVDYYWGSKYQALDQFLKKSSLFLPLGILWAFASARIYRRGAVPALLLVAFIAGIAIEAGRYFLPGHSASVTDILLQCVGAWLGFRLTQHVRALFWAESALYGYLYRKV